MATAFCCAVGLRTASSLRPAVRVVAPRTAPFASAAATSRKLPGILRPLVPSVALRAFVGDRAQPRSEVIKALSVYVKENGLQDPSNKSLVLCDARLKALLGVDSCSIIGMSKYISQHLSKPEDVGGKYIAEAKTFEENWLVANPAKAPKKSPDSAVKRATSSAEARANGTGLWAPVQLSSELAGLCGGRSLIPRQQVIKAVWSYIHENKLQAKAGAPITCDSKMKAVFKSDTVTAKLIMSKIQPHVTKVA
jgi:chromatin remodeling complex protein RSC6